MTRRPISIISNEIENETRPASTLDNYPSEKSYNALFGWHTRWGTRPNCSTSEPNEPWVPRHFYKRLFDKRIDDEKNESSPKRFYYLWTNIHKAPPWDPEKARKIEALLFGNDVRLLDHRSIFRKWRDDLRQAWKYRYKKEYFIDETVLEIAPKLEDEGPVFDLDYQAQRSSVATSPSSMAPERQHSVAPTSPNGAVTASPISDDYVGSTSPDERAVLFVIAASHEPLSADRLRGLLRARGVECADSLVAAGVIAPEPSYELAPQIAEPVLEKLCLLIADEVQERTPGLLVLAPLLDTREPEAAIQVRLDRILGRILAMLKSRGLRGHEIVERLTSMIADARTSEFRGTYLAGNIVNLIALEQRSLSGLNLSHLNLAHAYLRNTELRNTNLTHSRLEHCVFADLFGSVWQVGFRNNDSEVLASSASGAVRSWSIGTWANRETYGGANDSHRGWSFGFAVSTDGQELASAGGDGEIRVWRADGKLIDVLRGHTSRVRAVAFRPDGTLVSCSEDCTVLLWQRSYGVSSTPTELYRHRDRTTTLALSADGRFLITGASGGEVIVFDFDNLNEIVRRTAHNKEVRTVRVSDNGISGLSAGDDGRVLIWNLPSGKVVGEFQQANSQPVKAASFVGPGNEAVAVGTDDGEIAIWCAPFWERIHGWPAHNSLIRSLAASADGSMIVSGGDDQTVMVWNLNSGRDGQTLLRSFSGYSSGVRALAFTQSGALASAHDDGVVRIWAPETGKEAPPFSIEGHKGRIWSLAFHQSGRVLVTGAEDGKVRAWRFGNRLPFWTGDEHDYRVFAVATRDAPTPRIASAGSDATVRIWSTDQPSSLQVLASPEGHSRRVRDLAFSRDGRLLVTAGEDNCVIVWREADTGWQSVSRHAATAPVTAVCFSSDAKEVFFGTDAGLLVGWQPDNDAERIAAISEKPVLSVALAPDGAVIGVGCQDGGLHVVDAGSFDRLWTQQAHNDWVEQVAFSPDGTIIASASDDEYVRLWHRNGLVQKLPPIKASPPYDGLRIHGVTGIEATELERLRALGAIDKDED